MSYLTASTAYRRIVLIALSRCGARSFHAFDCKCSRLLEAVPLVDHRVLWRRCPLDCDNLSTSSVKRANTGSLECSLGKRGKGRLGRGIEPMIKPAVILPKIGEDDRTQLAGLAQLKEALHCCVLRTVMNAGEDALDSWR